MEPLHHAEGSNFVLHISKDVNLCRSSISFVSNITQNHVAVCLRTCVPWFDLLSLFRHRSFLGTCGKYYRDFVFRVDICLHSFNYRAADLAGGVWAAEVVGEPEVIDVTEFSGQLVLSPLELDDRILWITFPHDHVRPPVISTFTLQRLLLVMAALIILPVSTGAGHSSRYRLR